MRYLLGIMLCFVINISANAQLSRKAERMLKKGKFRDLTVMASRMIRNRDLRGYYLRGEISYQQKRYTSAIFNYKKCVASDECRAMALYSIAYSFARASNGDSALFYFERYLETGHQVYDYDVHQALSGFYFERDDLDEAEKHAAEMIRAEASIRNYSWAGFLYRYDMKNDLACLMYFKAIVKGSAEDRREFDDCNCGSWMDTWIKKDEPIP